MAEAIANSVKFVKIADGDIDESAAAIINNLAHQVDDNLLEKDAASYQIEHGDSASSSTVASEIPNRNNFLNKNIMSWCCGLFCIGIIMIIIYKIVLNSDKKKN